MPINQAIAVAESPETVGLKWLGGIIRESALPLRKGHQTRGVASQECAVLSDPKRSRGGRPIHESDPHLRVMRHQLVRVSNRVAAPRSRAGSQAGRVDALELSQQTRFRCRMLMQGGRKE